MRLSSRREKPVYLTLRGEETGTGRPGIRLPNGRNKGFRTGEEI